MDSWIPDELSDSDLGDRRLNARYRSLLKRLEAKPSLSLPGACQGWSETQAAYRFLSNPKVNKNKLLEPHVASTQQRLRAHPVVLCVEDTSFINYDGQRDTQGLGPHTSSLEHGYFLHPLIAVTPEKLCLGALRLHTWVRDKKLGKRRDNYQKKPIEEKESHRWIEGYRATSTVQKSLQDTQLVYLADRESDIYELFAEGLSGEADWLIRALRNRKTTDSNKLRDKLASSEALGQLTLTVNCQKRKRKRRQAILTLFSTQLCLRGPKRYKQDRLPDVTVSCILAVEANPPKNEKPIEWLLVTNLEVNSLAQAKEKLSWYACRWQIEIFFNTLKSGCQIEKLQLETRERLESAVVLYMIVAWRILYIRTLSRLSPDLPCDHVFTAAEWEAIYLITQQRMPPKTAPPLNQLVKLLASLGGHLGRKQDHPPGVKVLWIGLQRARDFVLALNIQKEVAMA